MNTTPIDGRLWILNNDGKNPFTDGTPQCQLGIFVKTKDFSDQVFSFGTE